MNLLDLLSVVPVDEITRKSPQKKLVLESKPSTTTRGAYEFEGNCLNFLLEKKHELGINSIYRISNGFVDCFITLDNGKSLAIEFKLQLDWHMSNVARSQINCFFVQKTYESLSLPEPEFGLILFKQFSRDWAKEESKRKHENGWSQFYYEQNIYNKNFKQIHILKIDENIIYNPFFSK